jgi:hypothetical protein
MGHAPSSPHVDDVKVAVPDVHSVGDEVRFAAHPSGVGVLPEFRAALETICVAPSLMASCLLEHKLAWLYAHGGAALAGRGGGVNPEVASPIVTAVVRKAFKISSDASAQRFVGVSVVVDGNGYPIRTCFFQDIMMFLEQLTWEGAPLLAALRHLEVADDADGLALACGLIARGYRECAARKRFVFNAIVQRCDVGGGSSPAAAAPPGGGGGDDGDGESLHKAVQRVFEASALYLEDVKTRAVMSTFVEPTMAYCAVVDGSVEGDVDVHGVSTYLAALQAVTGIKTSRMPAWGDEAKGTVHFLASGMARILPPLWKPEHLGKSYRAVPDFVAALRTSRLSRVPAHRFVLEECLSTRSMALRLCDARGPARARAALAPYVEQFASYFAADTLLPRLFTALTTGLAGSEDALLGALNRVCASLPADSAAGGLWRSAPADSRDVRTVVWDLDAEPPVFRLAAARELFDACGVTRRGPLLPFGDSDAATATPALRGRAVTTLPTVDAAAKGAPATIPPAHIRLSAAGDVRGGGTGREFLENLLHTSEEPWDKWLHASRASWVQADFVHTCRVQRIGLCSANDVPDRDPAVFQLRGRLPSGDWVVLHDVTTCPFTRRWQWLWYDVAPDAGGMDLRSVRIEILKPRRYEGCIQLGHLMFEGHSSRK